MWYTAIRRKRQPLPKENEHKLNLRVKQIQQKMEAATGSPAAAAAAVLEKSPVRKIRKSRRQRSGHTDSCKGGRPYTGQKLWRTGK